MNATLEDLLINELDRLGEVRDRATSISAANDEVQFDGELVDLDRLGCRFLRLHWRAPTLLGANAANTTELARRLAKRVCYLLEPLAVIECDAQSAAVQIRSQSPAVLAGSCGYYELTLSPEGGAVLERYAAAKGQTRRQTAAAVTREVLVRLVQDVGKTLVEA